MSTELIQSLSNDHSRAQVEALLRDALREPAFAELGALLQMWIGEHPGVFTALCRDIRDVTVEGWDALAAQIDARADCTAIGIDLSGYWEGTGPGFEVSFYDDTSFAFAASDRAAVLAATETNAPVWQGRYKEVQPLLTCAGLEALDAALRDYPYRHWAGTGPMPEDFPAYFAAVWFLYLRVNEALADRLDTDRLPRPVPVVVGQNDYGPSFETAYVVEQVAPDAEESLSIDEEESAAVETVDPVRLPETVAEPEAEANAEAESQDEPVPEVEAIGDETPEPSPPTRSWPWRRTAARAEAAEAGSTDPITQRRRGPGSFAA